MISRCTLVQAMVALTVGCVQDVPTLYVSTTAMVSVDLVPPDDRIPDDFRQYRWELSVAPETASDLSPTELTAAISVVPTTRGIYLYNRWFVGPAAEQLSCHVVVTVNGATATALITGPSEAIVGMATTFDGSASASTERPVLEYHWRLAVRPASSSATLADAEGSGLTFVPDIAGTYGIELRVFDGELWSRPATATLTAR